MDFSSFDAVILSNIIDNLYPDDAEVLIREVERVLKDKFKKAHCTIG
ncbi:class I SAM-dependent methyltransferase [Clostridium sp. KNHs214]|nr:class I SAM-dependent methyltransferase [Clostridium sp. KNHs214]